MRTVEQHQSVDISARGICVLLGNNSTAQGTVCDAIIQPVGNIYARILPLIWQSSQYTVILGAVRIHG